ncbi:MAG: heme exporter protein CcmB [Burkholderiales bacterium]|jgi:heme exporter protein B
MDALTALRWALRRDLMIALRRKADALQVLGFFVLAAALFPLAIGPQREWLQRIGPGAIWVCALLAVLLALPRLFESDHADGTLESMLASGQPLAALMAGKMLAAWLVSGAPLVVVSPVLALSFDLPPDLMPLLMLSLLLGTPVLLCIGAIASALTLGLKGGSTLVTLLCLPLYVPVLVFGAGALESTLAGLSAQAHLALLGAGMLITAVASPFVATLALRISVE